MGGLEGIGDAGRDVRAKLADEEGGPSTTGASEKLEQEFNGKTPLQAAIDEDRNADRAQKSPTRALKTVGSPEAPDKKGGLQPPKGSAMRPMPMRNATLRDNRDDRADAKLATAESSGGADSRFPSDRRYTPNGLWVLPMGPEGKQAVVGIAPNARDPLGPVVFVELPQRGSRVKQGEVVAAVESVKSAEDVVAPVTGTVTDVNDQINSNPDLLNTDPYGGGWLVRIDMTDPAQLEDLLTAKQYANRVGN